MWYAIEAGDTIATPSLAIFPDRVQANIERMKAIAPVSRLCPHVKTHKIAAITSMMIEAGISQFKCATTAELEMVAAAGAEFGLLAYQPVGPHIETLVRLARRYDQVEIGAVVDNLGSVSQLNNAARRQNVSVSILVDIDAGMGRTGIAPGGFAADLYTAINAASHLRVGGLHVYDGHIHDRDIDARRERVEAGMASVLALVSSIISTGLDVPRLLCGGTPSFPIHATHSDRICSPGTPVFWDAGYAESFPDLHFDPAAVLLTRVVSKLSDNRVCLDLGYKAIAAEMPHPRAEFLNLPAVQEIGHSEEHLVIEGALGQLQVGDLVYALPRHICPTVALHNHVLVVKDGKHEATWQTTARNRTAVA